MTLINTTDELAATCARLRTEPYVTVDTEFMRDRTYYPKLCLVQLGGTSEAYAVDPLDARLDLEPLFGLMRDADVLKVFHAARQDIEIFYHLMGKPPAPIFDTQIAAMVCGYGEEIGYDNLVQQVTGARIDKTSRFTDWAQRPLSDKQLRYALGDVTHLRQVYETLHAQMAEAGRADWLVEDTALLLRPELYEQPPETAWQRLKIRAKDRRFLAIVQALAAWRERKAREKDLPRARVLRDDVLMEVAANRPTDAQAVATIPRLSIDRNWHAEIAQAIQAALALPDKELPALPKQRRLAKGVGPIIDLLRVLLKQCCEQHGVAQRLIANGDDLEAIATGEVERVLAMQGWRYQVFGRQAEALLAGRVALMVEDGRHVTVIEQD